MLLYICIAAVIAASMLYHFSQKMLSSEGAPFTVMAITYGLAFLFCVIGSFFHGERLSSLQLTQGRLLPILLLALSVTGIEIGIYFTYKSGGNVYSLPVLINGAVTLCLIPVGYFFFKEQITLQAMVGIGLVISGIFCLTTR